MNGTPLLNNENGQIVPADQQRPPSDLADGERTDAQSFMHGPRGLIGGNCVIGGVGNPWCGGSLTPFSDPYAYGRWQWNGQLGWGTYTTYRMILAHSRIQQARAILTAPIVAGAWDAEGLPETPEDRVKLIKDMFLPLRRTYVEDALRAMDLGYSPFEPVYEVRKGIYWLTRLKPLLPDITTILHDGKGNFAGLRQGGPNGDLNAWKSFIYTFNGAYGDLYGTPLTENCRTTGWRMWLDASLQMHKIGEKLAGIIAMGFAPAGSYKDPVSGATVDYGTEMGKAMQGLNTTGMAVFRTLMSLSKPGMSANELQKMAESAMSRLEFYDAGNHSAAISGELERMQHAEDLMFAAYRLSSRTGMQSKNGSRADAEEHTDTGLVSSELIDSNIVDGLNQGVVDDVLELNYGPEARGTVKLKAMPLVDRAAKSSATIMQTALGSNALGPRLANMIDWNATAKSARVALMEGAKWEEMDTTTPVAPAPGTKPGDLKMSRDDAMGELVAQLSREAEEAEGLELDRGDDEDAGRWVTINGAHVLVRNGRIVDGPAHLEGKKYDLQPGEGRSAAKETKPAFDLNEHYKELADDPHAQELVKAKGRQIFTNQHVGTGTIERVNPPSDKHPHGSVTVRGRKKVDPASGKLREGEKVVYDFLELRDRLRRGDSTWGP